MPVRSQPDSLVPTQASQALTYDELQGLTYLQVKGSGIANTCPVLEGGSSNLKDLKAGSYNMSKFCLEPTSFTVKEESQLKGGEPEFVKTKLMTRLTYTLDEVHIHSFSRQAAISSAVATRLHVGTHAAIGVFWLCMAYLRASSWAV